MSIPPLTAIATATCLALAAPSLKATEVVDLSEVQVPQIQGSSPGDRLGYAVAAGDLDGDGHDELVVSAPGVDVPGVGEDAGAVYIFGPDVVSDAGEPSSPSSALLTLTGSHALERFGETLCVADLNADGQLDLLVGATDWGPEDRMLSGRVYVYLGPLRPERDASGAPASVGGFDAAHAVVDGSRAGDRFGSSIVVADVMGTEAPELIVSACRAADAAGLRAGSVYVIAASALLGGPVEQSVTTASSAELRGEADGDALCTVAVTRPGPSSTATIALGAYQADGGSNSMDAGKVYFVRADRIASLPLHEAIEIDAPIVLGPHPRSFLGGSLAVGDMDGDGLQDIAMSAYASRAQRTKADASGEVFLVFGSEVASPDVLDLADADVPTFVSASRWDLFGLPILFEDMNGDGRDDLIACAQFADGDGTRRRCGSVYVFRGGPRSVIEVKTGSADRADVIVIGARPFDSIGSSLSTARLTGQSPDLVIGAADAGENELDASADAPAAGVVLIVPASAVAGH